MQLVVPRANFKPFEPFEPEPPFHLKNVNYIEVYRLMVHLSFIFASMMEKEINNNKLREVIGRLNEINNCVSHMERLRDSYCIEIMREWSAQLSKDFPKLKKCEFISPDHSYLLYTGVAIPYKQLPESIHILIQARNGILFYGLKNLPKLDDKHDEIQKELSYVAVCNDLLKSEKWLYYRCVSFDKGYEKLKELITNMTE